MGRLPAARAEDNRRAHPAGTLRELYVFGSFLNMLPAGPQLHRDSTICR